MTKSPSRRDLEALSAYLDRQLSTRHARKLETRLKAEPELQNALEDLRQTKRVLRSASPVRRPRNYTLTPEMAGSQVTMPRGYNAMRLVAVTASLLFAFVFAGDLLFGGSPLASVASAPMAEPAMEFYMQDAADEAKVETNEEAEAPMALGASEPDAESALPQERAVEAELPVEGTPTESVSVEAAVPKAAESDGSAEPDALTTPDAAAEDTAGADAENLADTTGTPTLMGTPHPPDVASLPPESPPAPPEGAPPLDMAATGEGGPADDAGGLPIEEPLIEGDTLEKTIDAPKEVTDTGTKLSAIQIVEGGLILIAVLSGVLAFYMRHRMD